VFLNLFTYLLTYFFTCGNVLVVLLYQLRSSITDEFVSRQVCVSPDSQQILTVSGDKTAKIWDVSTSSVVQSVSIISLQCETVFRLYTCFLRMLQYTLWKLLFFIIDTMQLLYIYLP